MSDNVVLELLGSDDFALEQVNETLIPKINDIGQLNSLMKTIEYGFYSHEKEENVKSSINSRMSKEYHLQAPETTIQKRIGLCWDTVLVAKYYLNKLGYQTKMFFMCTHDMAHTHTFILYKEVKGNNKNVLWHWYEWSWEPFIEQDYNAKEVDELIQNFISFKYSKENGVPVKLYSVSGYPKIGVGPDAFIQQMVQKSKLIGICDARSATFNPAPVNDRRNEKEVPATEDYYDRDVNGNVTVVTETVDSVYSDLDKEVIFTLMRSYVDDQLDDKKCEHILRHYIANCLQHQWWVRKFTEELADRHYSVTRFIAADYLRVLHDVVLHDSDKLHRIETIAAYAVRVYNQHWEEGMDEVHELNINAMGKEAIDEAWANHVETQPHHPEHWDNKWVLDSKDEDDKKPVDGSKMPDRYLVQLAGDWMSASILRHKTATDWYKKTVGTRFIFTEKQCELLCELFEHEEELVQKYIGKNPFATESFGVDTNTVPADIKDVNVVAGVGPGVTRVADDNIEVKHVDPVTGKVVKVTKTNDHRNPVKKTDLPPSPEFDPNVVIGVEKYEPPYNAEQMRQNGYSEDIIKKLEADPVHKWRMDTGIELIHREPTKSELLRIWKNWQQMTVEQKKKSDAKCIELFGCDNKTLYDFLIVQYKTETPNKNDIKYPTAEDLAQEALGGTQKQSKKQRIIDYVVTCLNLIDPTGDNGRRFSDFVSPMSDKEFAQYIQNLKDRKCHIDIVAPNMKKPLQLNDVFAAAHKINCKLFQRVWFYDMTTGKEFLSTEELPVFRLTVRRQEQMLDEKLSVPDKASKIDALTGQVTGDDKAGGFSTPEIQIMYSKGFKNVLKEFVKVRGGDVHAFGEFERQLEETGEGSMDQIRVNSRARSGAVLSAWLEALHLENNI